MNITKLITGPFSINTWIIPFYQNKVLIIDPAACDLTHDQNKITYYLEQNNLEPTAILLTHGHFYHIPGTKILKEKYPDLPIICHKADAEIAGSQAPSYQAQALSLMGLEMLIPAITNLPDCDITYSTDCTLDTLLQDFIKDPLQDLLSSLKKWQILCTPGHTPGSVCIYNKTENILFSGDTIFYHSYGRTDLPGGSEATIKHSLNMLYSTLSPDTKVYPGHDLAGFALEENL